MLLAGLVAMFMDELRALDLRLDALKAKGSISHYFCFDDSFTCLFQEFIFLCKEDTMEETAESIEDAESETKIDMFWNWWNQLPSLKKPLPVDLIKEIVGK